MSSVMMMQDAQRIANDQIHNSIRNVIQSIILQIYQSIVLSKQQQQQQQQTLDNIVENEDIFIDNDDGRIIGSIKDVLNQFHSIFTLKLIELGYNNVDMIQQEWLKTTSVLFDNEQIIRSTIESIRRNNLTNNIYPIDRTTTTALNQSNKYNSNDDDDDDDLDDILASKTSTADVNNDRNIGENNQNQSNNITTSAATTTTTTTSVPFTAWAKLRQLGRDNSTNQRDILSPIPESSSTTNSTSSNRSYSNNIQQYIDILDRYGYNNDTYWIYNQWKYIDQYTKEQIDLRLHYISPLSNVSMLIQHKQQQQQQSQMKQVQSHNQSSSSMTNDRNNHNTLPVTTIDNTNDLRQQWDTKHLVSNALLSQHQTEQVQQQQQSSSLKDNNTLPVENSNNTNQLETTTTLNNSNYNETIQQLIDRKRKSLHKKRKWDTTLQKFIPKTQNINNKKQMKDDDNNATMSKVITLPEIPRYPSNDNGTTQLQWQHTINDLLLSDPNIANDLNEYVHKNNSNDTTQQSSSSLSTSSDQQQHNTNDSNTNSLLIGSVCEIGQYHCYQQQSCNINNNSNNRSSTTSPADNIQTNILHSLSEKQKKQYQRKAIRTRLGDHIPIRATDEIYQTNNSNSNNTNKPWSRIVRTIATTKDNPIPYNITTQQQQQPQLEYEEISNERIEIELLKSQYYFDFDLGYCTLELPTGTLVEDHPEQQQSRTVYTFSSIEVLLHD